MANLNEFYGGQFNAYDIDFSSGGANLPVSDPNGLPVIITDSPVEPSKNIDGCYLIKFHLQVIEGEHAGAEGVWNLNIAHPTSEDAVRIAWENIAKLAVATGQPMAQTTEELHNIPFRVITAATTYKGNDGVERKGSEVKKVLNYDGSNVSNDPSKQSNRQPSQASAQQSRPQQSNPAPEKPKWQKNPATETQSAPQTNTAAEKPPWVK